VRDEGGNILIYSEAWERGSVAGRGAGAAAGDAGDWSADLWSHGERSIGLQTFFSGIK
jgi:hypothetical protein